MCNLPIIENGNSCINRHEDLVQQTSYFSGFCFFLKESFFWNTFFKTGFPSCLAEDFKEHAKLCDQLLGHYSAQFDDRRVYWAARNRSTYQRDLLCVIIDSFDRSKLCLPSFPFGRCPKRTVYEFFSRHLAVYFWIIYVKNLKASLMFTVVSRHMISSVPEQCPKKKIKAHPF